MADQDVLATPPPPAVSAGVANSDVQQRFEAAVSFIKSLPSASSASPASTVSLSNEEKLRFYALYKQATQGRNNSPVPSFWDQVGRFKHAAWSKLGDMDKTQAMQMYVEEILKKAPELPPSDQLTRLLQSVTPAKKVASLRESDVKDTPVASGDTSESLRTAVTPSVVSLSAADRKQMEEVQQTEARLARQVEELRESVLVDTLKVARLEALLQSSDISAGQPLAGVGGGMLEVRTELLETLKAIDVSLREGKKERDILMDRIDGKITGLNGALGFPS